ncbi:MAG: ATP-binding cassette domain-containing protein [Deltaproteobacteria bacterium]|nr:ATP-binding cassette domain-containing protein [Deltaproteobacteria bacterium]
MLSVNDVSHAYGGRSLFENVTATFPPGRRFGLTGPNGAGKSTFMKLLAGDAEPQRGSVSRPAKTSILRQDQHAYDDHRVVDVVIMGNKRLWAATAEKNAILAQLEAGIEMTEDMGLRLGDLEVVVGEEDGYVAEGEGSKLLSGLGIADELHSGFMRELSGGTKLRVLLAQALFGKPDCLLLDEPTNHLDLDSIRWLEEFLKGYAGTLVVISHDRHFLNSVATHIADIDYQTIITYTGNYDDMVVQKSEVRGRVESDNADKAKKVAQLKDFVARFGAGTRASQVQSRKKEIEKLQPADLKKSNIERPYIRFETGGRPSGKQVIRVESLSKTFREPGKPDIPIVKDFHLTLMRGDKLAIIGPSAIGKTTLLRLILGELAADAGTVSWGHEVRTGYFAQDHSHGIPPNVPLWEWLYSLDEPPTPAQAASKEDIRNLLGRMLFSKDEALKATHVLSGGETARLLFAKLMLLKHNLLIFDEPTNHLDLESISALKDAVVKYDGTVIFVTHDRDLVADAATRVLALSKHGIDDFQGPYDEFLRKVGDVRLDR